ncbi:methyltransferase domain-containing protein [Alteromonas sp. 345S023]|uniref:Methyltransferase domain-containing protein n=1 Tax=Alteromonas profundi TaxID=2696062 RepID=A0A7X5LK69_9ALTE|nr:class I SAM-dependent methyltransferase [Alteromonas profundi]NDV90890.1 methyltransferase domain-containing protein [Alteromonas profundi]
MNCPLCDYSNSPSLYHQDNRRRYHQCLRCQLVFVDPLYLPASNVEKAEYELHQNSSHDEGYIRFLDKLLSPLSLYFEPNMDVLDFGCGPGPVLGELMAKKGMNVKLYDPFFAHYPENLDQGYDIITCTEAIEHFHTPSIEWQCWLNILKPKGILGIMTKRVIDKQRFASWHYKNDPTHVSFFSEATFRYLALRDGFSVEFPTNDVVLMKKL